MAKLSQISALEQQITKSQMDFKELDEKLGTLTKDRDYHETQNVELNKLLGEAKAKIAELEKKLANVPKPP